MDAAQIVVREPCDLYWLRSILWTLLMDTDSSERNAPAVLLRAAGREAVIQRAGTRRQAAKLAGRFHRELDDMGLEQFCETYDLRLAGTT